MRKYVLSIRIQTAQWKKFSFSELTDKTVLLVNTASKCGFTSQYSGLEELYQKFKNKKFIVLGFPCNQFGAQEPGDAKEISEFCSINYGVSFPILEKGDVKGDNQSAIYKFLLEKSQIKSDIKWNFEKFLIDSSGKVVGRYPSKTTPLELVDTIQKLL